MERSRLAQDAPGEAPPIAIRAHLEVLLASPSFAPYTRRTRLLRYLVERTLNRESERDH